MPVLTLILFLAVMWGLAVFIVLAFMHGATSKPTPITRARARHLWIVDEDRP